VRAPAGPKEKKKVKGKGRPRRSPGKKRKRGGGYLPLREKKKENLRNRKKTS